MWVNPISVAVTKYLIYKGTSPTSSVSWVLKIEGGTGRLRFEIYDSGGDRIGRETADDTLVANVWNHIIISYDGSETNGGIKIFLNTSQVDAADRGSGTYNVMNDSSTPLRMSHTSSSFNGYIDQVVIFDKELSTIEIASLYNLGRGTEECEGNYLQTSSSTSSSSSVDSSSSSSS